MIQIIDCGSQLTQNIARRIRELGVYAEIIPHNKANAAPRPDLEGIIISGGQHSVYDDGAPLYYRAILEMGVPVLGICYGQQSIAHLLGGEVRPAAQREYGETKIRIERQSKLFDGVPLESTVWMSHGDIVDRMPDGFEAVATSSNGHISAMEGGRIYAVQFHPEVDHTEHGRKILENFLSICGARRDWDPETQYQKIIEETSQKADGKTGIGGISGGVDSTTASALMSKICGDQYHPIFVNNGLLRLNEETEVMELFSRIGIEVHYVDASSLFLDRLRGVTEPDEKRKIIGHTFIEVFEQEARKIEERSGLEKIDYLMQGTLYPDVIESVPIHGSSSKIKRHHNVGGLPERMGLSVIEPFCRLFKDEVRRIAQEKLGIPREIAYRHPFPGPGLAVRVIGEVTPEKLALLRQADAIFIKEIKARGWYYDISQAFAVLTNAHSVGVMGDGGTYQGVIALRAVTTNDFMTSDCYQISTKDLTSIANRIIGEVKGVNRVVYDVTQKPPGTIEWE